MDLSIIENGKVRSLQDIRDVDALLQKVRGKGVWEVTDFIIKIFEKRFPEYSHAIGVANQERKKDLLRSTGSNKDRGMRHLISMPPQLKDLMDYFLVNYENPTFWREFARRYPQYRVPDKI